MSERLAILIGNSRSECDPSLPPLFGPRHDVSSLGRLLSDPDVGNFVTFELIDRSSSQLGPELERLFAMAGPESTVLVYYAGHVLHDAARGLFLGTVDAELIDLKDSALPLATLKGLLRASGAADIVVVLDCCYCSASGAVDEADIEHELRRLRTDVGSHIHVIASPASTQTPEAREVSADSGLEGNMTRCIVEGLATGAADRNADNSTGVRDLNEYLGMRMGNDRPLWAGPLEGANPEIVANPNPIEGLDIATPGGSEEASRVVRRALQVVGAAVVVAVLAVVGYVATRPELQTTTVLDEFYAESGLPPEVAIVAGIDNLRRSLDRTGWIEHIEVLDGAGQNYPDIATVRIDPTNRGAPGTLALTAFHWALVELGDGVYAVGFEAAPGLNVADVVVEMIDGQRYSFNIRTDRSERRFIGFVARQPLRRVRIRASTPGFSVERLYLYADREYAHADVERRR